MSVIFVLIGFSSFVAIMFLAAYIWSVKTGQYDDNYTPSIRILFDNEVKKETSKKNS
ncbi:MAG: cbb3-type cytochrome oxidase assembly protein CcoS [Ignavibacteriae bacterium]|nr:cbb3-type cytochrome oxidase assembly protein CcoS [Ignavibacteriota bacterium]MCB0750188.1 cbb3-type cytochrome oxidase assembly protein CcoS [Ignavibacteriota bacterium]MCB9207918.1 cbb3-type cytochrome oxidase assembly protein CcoS [Ignavibacteriales bacterium]MCB9258688.1 cbb3-type cytochrome oxidase assembly protein CcoS [Ignavibacteriales bacterium]